MYARALLAAASHFPSPLQAKAWQSLGAVMEAIGLATCRFTSSIVLVLAL